MMNRKLPGYVLALSFAVLISAGVLCASAADGPAAAAFQEDPQQAFAAFAQRLKLTPAQQTQIKPLFEARNEKILAIFDKHSGDTSRMGKMQAMREAQGVQEDFSGKLKPLLTSDQKTELEAMRAEGRAKAEQLYEARKGGGAQRP